MDIDFHFGTIYVLSRWAGIEEDTALVIATGSQLVDDNTEKDVGPGKLRYSGHEVTENITDLSNNDRIWIPFHFLPGLEGENNASKLVCKKNTGLAVMLRERMLAIGNLNSDLNNRVSRLAVDLHVYADTWAHQGFIGRVSNLNDVEDLKGIYSADNHLEEFEEKNFIDKVPALGHAQAVHWPDRPFAEWGCLSSFQTGRKNWDEFMEAAFYIYEILAKLHGNDSWILPVDKKLMLENFMRVNSSNMYELRNKIWVEFINDGYFGFKDKTPKDYSAGLILDDPDYGPAFYRAVEEHFNWVKDELALAGVKCNL